MYGVIDIGSNTIRLLIYEIDKDSNIKQTLNKKKVAGLARYIDTNKVMSKKGIEKTIDALKDFKITLKRNHIEKVFVFATASIRNIKNTKEVIEKIYNETEIKVEVLSGEQEAYYDFIGSKHVLDIAQGLIVDIGGGSTELIFVNNGQPEKAISIPVGSLNMYSKFVEKLIPTEEESKKIKKCIIKHLEKIELSNNEYAMAFGIGGTIRGACKINNEIFDNLSENRKIPVRNVKKLVNKFIEGPKEAVSIILEVVPDRIHTIIPGMIILKTIMKYYNCEIITISPFGIREGYIIENVINKSKNINALEKEEAENKSEISENENYKKETLEKKTDDNN